VFVKQSSVKKSKTKGIHGAAIAFSLMISVALMSAACGRSSAALTNTYQIPWPDQQGNYQLQPVVLKSFDRPSQLQGRDVKLFVDPYVRNGRLESTEPVGRFARTNDGVNVPSDYLTLQATVVHAHYERLRQMDEAVGAKVSWPATIGIQANVSDGAGPIHNNAIFDSRLDALLVVPYVDKELPVSMNAGVLAHEHFHKIFQTAILNRMGEDGTVIGKPNGEKASDPLGLTARCDWNHVAGIREVIRMPKILGEVLEPLEAPSEKDLAQAYNIVFLRALNEGLADYWGWVYTGDANFVAKSLPQIENVRKLDEPSTGLISVNAKRTTLEKWLKLKLAGDPSGEDVLTALSYEWGTVYARALYEATVAAFPEAPKKREDRLVMAKAIASALPDFAIQAVSSQKSGRFLSPNSLFKVLQPRLSGKAKDSCQVLLRLSAVEAFGEPPPFECSNAKVNPLTAPALKILKPKPEGPEEEPLKQGEALTW
jgi:hypothetical protein